MVDSRWRLEPIFSVVSNKVHGYEVLSRNTRLYSDPFLSYSSEMRDADIGACREAGVSQIGCLFINIEATTAIQYYDDVIRELAGCQETRILEITERHSASPEIIANLALFARRIRTAFPAVQIALDDIDSWNNPVASIREIRPNMLKCHHANTQDVFAWIRQSGIPADEINVVAECIETPQQMSAAIADGCHFLQGFYIKDLVDEQRKGA